MLNSIVVALGGALGSLLRYLVGLIPVSEQFLFPIKTFLINIGGSLLIGLVAALSIKANMSPKVILFLKVGICGGFTTYSTFALETSTLLKSGHFMVALLYVLLSLALGVGVIFGVEWLTLHFYK